MSLIGFAGLCLALDGMSNTLAQNPLPSRKTDLTDGSLRGRQRQTRAGGSGTLAGAIYVDNDDDGQWALDAEPLALAPLTITLYTYDSARGDPALGDQFGAPILTLLSSSGRFTFTGLTPGGYVVAVSPLPGFLPTTLIRRPTLLTANQPPPDLAFGLKPVPASAASNANGAGTGAGRANGIVFDDANNDGRLTPGERGLAGVIVTVTLHQAGVAPITTTTRSDGAFGLPLPAGVATFTAGLAGRIATGPDRLSRAIEPGQSGEVRFAQSSRPNFLFILTDDQPYQTVVGDGDQMTGVLETVSERVMPHTWANIFAQGLVFTDAHVATPLCCPSRANFFSGRYAHNTGVIDNAIPLAQTGYLSAATVVSYLASLGYYNGLVGKYLNNYRFDVVDTAHKPPEFDYWVHRCESNDVSPGAQQCYEYWGASFNVYTLAAPSGWTLKDGYVPYIERDYALDFIDAASQRSQPFFLVYASLSPHSQTTLSPRPPGVKTHKWADPAPDEPTATLILSAEVGLHRPPSFNVVAATSPSYLRAGPVLAGSDLSLSDNLRLGMLQSLQSFDRTVLSLTQRLDALGMTTNTVVIFISDNGFLFGEHKAVRKTKVYQESTRVPFAIRYPALLETSRVVSQLAANIDVAPTILDLAGFTGTITPAMDGLSLAPLFTSTEPLSPDRALVIEGWAPELPPIHPPYAAIRTSTYLYVENQCDAPEFYAVTDTWQLTNTATTPDAFDPQEAEARDRLAGMGLGRGTQACARAFGGIYLALAGRAPATVLQAVPYAGANGQVVIAYGAGLSATRRNAVTLSGAYTTALYGNYQGMDKTEGFVISPNVPTTVTLQGFGAVSPTAYVFTQGFAPGSTNGPYDFHIIAFAESVWMPLVLNDVRQEN